MSIAEEDRLDELIALHSTEIAKRINKGLGEKGIQIQQRSGDEDSSSIPTFGNDKCLRRPPSTRKVKLGAVLVYYGPSAENTGLHLNCQHSVKLLRQHGISATTASAAALPPSKALLKKSKVRVIIFSAFCTPLTLIKSLAQKLPDIMFIQRCHSNLSFLGTEDEGYGKMLSYIRLSQQVKNFHYCLVNEEEAQALSDILGQEVVYLPNPYVNQGSKNRKSKDLNEDLINISLIFAMRPLKNPLTQVAATCLLNKRHRTRLIVQTSDDGQKDFLMDQIRRLCRAGQTKLKEVKWMPHPRYKDFIARNVDVGLQVSYTESFNYVALDHLSLGIPVIGSDAIRYLPRKWQAKCDSIADIAAKVVSVIEGYTEASDVALQCADKVIKKSNRTFLETIRRLME